MSVPLPEEEACILLKICENLRNLRIDLFSGLPFFLPGSLLSRSLMR